MHKRDWIETGCRLAIGVVLLWSGAAKIVQPAAFYNNVLEYRVLGESGAAIVATVLPWVELVMGLGLMSGVAAPGAMVGAAVMLTAFTGLHISVLVRGMEIACGCFSGTSGEMISGWSVGRNAGLTAVAITGVLMSRRIHEPRQSPEAMAEMVS